MNQVQYKLLVIFLILLFCIGCTHQDGVSPPDRLVYVEGKELTAGRFGDLAMLGPDIVGKQVLNRDSYYDSWPILLDSNRVIFLSKRREGDKQFGLSKYDDLYIYSSDSITPIFSWTEQNILHFYHYDKILQKVMFKKSVLNSEGPEHEIILQSIADSSERKIIYHNGFDVLMVKTPNNNKYLLLEKRFFNKLPYFGKLYLYDIDNETESEVLANKHDLELGLLSDIDCMAGDFISDYKFLFSCISYRNNSSIIFSYTIEDESLSEIFRSNELAIRNPVSNYTSQKIYFLASEFDSDDLYENIWMIDKYGAPGDSAVQLTNTRLNKDWLQIEN